MAIVTCKGFTYAKVSGGGAGSAETYTGGAALVDYLAKVDINEERTNEDEYADGHKIDSEKIPTGVSADLHALTELEVGDGLLGHGGNGVLTGDGADVLDDGLESLGVVLAVAAADRHDDLVDLGDLHGGLVLELLHQSRSNFLEVLFLHTSHSQLSPFSQSSAPHFLQTRTFLSPTILWPTRVALPHLGQTSCTLLA